MSLSGITKLHDFVTSTVSRCTTLKCKDNCYNGSLLTTAIQKLQTPSPCSNPSSYVLISPTLSKEKLQQLTDQHDRFIKADVDGYVHPAFLHAPPLAAATSSSTANVVSKVKRGCSLCDGNGHVLPGKKRHYSEK